jgi:hypothetical protein
MDKGKKKKGRDEIQSGKRARPSPLSGHTLTDDHRRRRLGRVQRQVQRALIAAGGRGCRIRDLLSWAFPALTTWRDWHRSSVHRAARRVAAVLDRDARGVIWGLKSSRNLPKRKQDPSNHANM